MANTANPGGSRGNERPANDNQPDNRPTPKGNPHGNERTTPNTDRKNK